MAAVADLLTENKTKSLSAFLCCRCQARASAHTVNKFEKSYLNEFRNGIGFETFSLSLSLRRRTLGNQSKGSAFPKEKLSRRRGLDEEEEEKRQGQLFVVQK